MAEQITLDTNLLVEYWKEQERRETVQKLLDLSETGAIELAVTSRIRQDVPAPPLSEMINHLPEIGVTESGSVTRLGYWQLGVDQLGDDAFAAFSAKVAELAASSGQREPDWRDWDHLHAHYLQGRDVFLTWDSGILHIADQLRDEFGIVVTTPEHYLRSHQSE